jgi:hypothetical protein
MTDALGGQSVSQVEQIIEVRGAAEAASIRKAGFRSSPTVPNFAQILPTIAAMCGLLAWGQSVEQDQDKPRINAI